MEPIYIPSEDDIKRWINDAVDQSLQRWLGNPSIATQLDRTEDEPLLAGALKLIL